jgi:hypothetical protein
VHNLKDARSSFYTWLAGTDARVARTAADAALQAPIHTVHYADNTYGAPRITAELNDGAPPGGGWITSGWPG